MDVNWFPGHMKVTRDLIRSKINMVDIVFELLDARAPISTKVVTFNAIKKPKLILLNKSDLSSKNANLQWIRYFNKNGLKSISISANNSKTLELLHKAAKQILKTKQPLIRGLVVGTPNVGKSTLINYLSSKKKTKVENRPGVTKNIQRIKVKNSLYLLDTPGLLDFKENSNVDLNNLIFIGAIKDELVDIESAALNLIKILHKIAPTSLVERYEINEKLNSDHSLFEEIAQKRGCLKKNNIIDYDKAAKIVLNDFRKGLLGRFTLELPLDIK